MARSDRVGSGVVVGLVMALSPGVVAAQHGMGDGVRFGAQAIGLVTRADPAVGGDALTEGYLTQPMLMAMAEALGGRLALHATLNLEGMTLRRGELNAGQAGEGYVDRRHPHTYVHELVASASGSAGDWRGSLTAGRGFAPFGTDDPMTRPFVKYPANHHWSQILERWVAIGGVGYGPLVLEGALFNGDEPTGPASLGRIARFGDSWAARLTARPVPGLELQGSRAHIASPENVFGGGLDQRKWSASARYEAPVHPFDGLYALAEVARTEELSGGTPAFIFTTVLAEVAGERGGWLGALRYERTTRPEEERLNTPFRSLRPHNDENIIGATRWNTWTARLERTVERGAFAFTPFVEGSRLYVRELTGSVFNPERFYGSDMHWSLSVGGRIGAGMRHERMGRYGVALASPAHDMAAIHGMH